MSIVGSRAVAVHDEACPDIGPVCASRSEPPQRHHTTLWASDVRLLGEYGLARGFAVQAIVPVRLIDTRTVFTDLADHPLVLDYRSIHHRDETLTGLGDAQLLLHAGFKLGAASVGLRAGASLPFGKVHEDPFRLGALGLAHEHIQLGTGTVDPVLSLDASLALGGTTLAAFSGLQALLYEGGTGYRAGVRSLAGAVVARPVGPVSLRLSAAVVHEQPERWQGRVPSDDGNQGRTDLYLAPGATFAFGDWSVSADVRARVLSQVVNAQLEMPLVVELSVGRLLHLEQGRDEAPAGAAGSAGGDVLDVVQAGELADLVPASGKWTVFDFWAPWCEACKGLDARLRKLAAERPGLAVRRVNIVDFDSPIARRELPGVELLPRLRLVDAGGGRAFERSGPADELYEEIERRTATAGPPGPRADGPRAEGARAEAPRVEEPRDRTAPHPAPAPPVTVELAVTEDGFAPARATVPAGRPLRLVVTRKTEQTCATEIVVAGHTHALPLGAPVVIELPAQPRGPLRYACGMAMLRGVLDVE